MNFIHEHPDDVAYISRDSIRFEMLKPDEDYFAHENDVFATFIHRLNDAIENGDKHWIIADATHLNEFSRNRTLSAIKTSEVNIIPVYFNVSPDICQIRNCARTGRAKVPEKTISDMARRLTFPQFDSRWKYHEIWYIDEFNEISSKEEFSYG